MIEVKFNIARAFRKNGLKYFFEILNLIYSELLVDGLNYFYIIPFDKVV